MHKLIAMYRKPDDPDAFTERYFGSHMPLVGRTPGLVRAEVANVARVLVPGFLEEHEPFLFTELWFDSEESAKEAFRSPEWQAAGANLTEIGGMPLVAMFTADIVD